MIVVVTGQVGVDKKPYLLDVQQRAAAAGHCVRLAHVGDRMYAEAPDIAPGRILDLPLSRLNALRRSVFKDIITEAHSGDHLIVNTHATFRWRHGLFPAFDFDQMKQLDADFYVTLVDNVDVVHHRLMCGHNVSHDLKDVLVWREEEILATEVLSQIARGHGCFYILARGRAMDSAESFMRLIFEPKRKRVYPSFPMSHVMDMPATLAQINDFRAQLARHFITFDPGDVDEKYMLYAAEQARQKGQQEFTLECDGVDVVFGVDSVLALARDIDGQIYARDFKLIDQAEMIVSLIPELQGGKPGLSSGVERELQHAHEHAKEVYVVWIPKADPSPFITATATRVFSGVNEALEYFANKGYL